MRIDERYNQPMVDLTKKNLDREGHKQGLNPQDDIFEDKLDDNGQEIEEELTAEEQAGGG